jgi:S-adenosylmethionine:tRNA ribosyltransferase-isomerase
VSDRSFQRSAAPAAPGDLLVMNDTRVLHARLLGRKDSGGQVEVLVERLTGDITRRSAQVRASKTPQPGSRLRWKTPSISRCSAATGEFYRLRFFGDASPS